MSKNAPSWPMSRETASGRQSFTHACKENFEGIPFRCMLSKIKIKEGVLIQKSQILKNEGIQQISTVRTLEICLSCEICISPPTSAGISNPSFPYLKRQATSLITKKNTHPSEIVLQHARGVCTTIIWRYSFNKIVFFRVNSPLRKPEEPYKSPSGR